MMDNVIHGVGCHDRNSLAIEPHCKLINVSNITVHFHYL